MIPTLVAQCPSHAGSCKMTDRECLDGDIKIKTPFACRVPDMMLTSPGIVARVSL